MTVGQLTASGFIAATTDDIQTELEQDELATIGAGTDLTSEQPLGQINGIFASAGQLLSSLILAVFTALDPDGAEGVQLDNLCALTGCERLPATPTVVATLCNLNAGTYAAGALVAAVTGAPSLTFTNPNPLTVAAAGTISVSFAATATGPIAVNANTLVIAQTTNGWNSITNSAGTTGTNVESDTALRLRRASLLVASGGCTLDSIRASLLNPALVPGIISVNILENNTLSNDVNAQPGKSFQALIWDGPSAAASNATIAQAIWNSKPSGILSFGQTAATATDSTGRVQTVAFTRLTPVRLYASLTRVIDPTMYPANGDAQIQAAVAAIVAGIVPGVTGSEVYALRLRAAALSVTGVVDVTTFGIDTIYPSPNTSNLAFSPFVIPTLAATDVYVFAPFGLP